MFKMPTNSPLFFRIYSSIIVITYEFLYLMLTSNKVHRIDNKLIDSKQ